MTYQEKIDWIKAIVIGTDGTKKWVNAPGTGDKKCECKTEFPSWKEHWKYFVKLYFSWIEKKQYNDSAIFPKKCACGCGKEIKDDETTHGAHIIREDKLNEIKKELRINSCYDDSGELRSGVKRKIDEAINRGDVWIVLMHRDCNNPNIQSNDLPFVLNKTTLVNANPKKTCELPE